MNPIAWIKSLFGRRPTTDFVPFYDVPSGQVVQIPPSELSPGCIQVRLQGQGIVWVLPEQLQQGEIRHPPFQEKVLSLIREIQTTFTEHRPLSLEEWEDGFRRDANPEQEIALFLHAAKVYRAFTAEEQSAERRRDVYGVIIACLTTSPDSVWKALKLQALSRPEAEQIIQRFYHGNKALGPT